MTVRDKLSNEDKVPIACSELGTKQYSDKQRRFGTLQKRLSSWTEQVLPSLICFSWISASRLHVHLKKVNN